MMEMVKELGIIEGTGMESEYSSGGAGPLHTSENSLKLDMQDCYMQVKWHWWMMITTSIW